MQRAAFDTKLPVAEAARRNRLQRCIALLADDKFAGIKPPYSKATANAIASAMKR